MTPAERAAEIVDSMLQLNSEFLTLLDSIDTPAQSAWRNDMVAIRRHLAGLPCRNGER